MFLTLNYFSVYHIFKFLIYCFLKYFYPHIINYVNLINYFIFLCCIILWGEFVNGCFQYSWYLSQLFNSMNTITRWYSRGEE